ncbi:OmpA family protein [Amycolatopsis lurida]
MSEELVAVPSIAHATLLARNGEYAEAERVLGELGGRDSTDPAVLDLLARIHAQRGELLDADQCWALALRLDADHLPARDGRKRIKALATRRPRPGRVVLVVALAAVAAGGAGVAGGLIGDRSGALVAELDKIQDGQRAQADRLDDLGGRLDQTTSRPRRAVDDFAAALAGHPALVARTDAEAITVTFPTGVFRAGTRLSDSGSAALADLVRLLGPAAANVTITVVGHTEDARVSGGSGYTTNAELGLARAMTAAERMSEVSGLPPATFALSSSGAANPPFPNTTAEGRERNRTVTVVVRPR